MIKAEYRDLPGLQLTTPEVQRMWGLGESNCALVLDMLQAAPCHGRVEQVMDLWLRC